MGQYSAFAAAVNCKVVHRNRTDCFPRYSLPAPFVRRSAAGDRQRELPDVVQAPGVHAARARDAEGELLPARAERDELPDLRGSADGP